MAGAVLPAESVILAIASPPGRSLRGIIRMSGRGAFALIEPVSEPKVVASSPSQIARRGVSTVVLSLGGIRSLPMLQWSFKGPRSYTGEDSIEWQLAGNPLLLARVMNDLIASGRERGIDVRAAQPGEFTARAYLNGRLDLTQAEGVAATIAAQSDAELSAARMLVSGRLGALAHAWANDLAAALALVEAGIDFTDQDDVVAIAPDDLHARLVDLRQRLAHTLERALGMEQLRAIPWVVLVGEPNAGKSALFNALLGRERAVVSSIAGTTRDVLAEPLRIDTDHGPAEVMLVDVAGLDADDASSLNTQMQSAAAAAIKRAELRLCCVPSDAPESSIARGASPGNELIVRTKSDLMPPSTREGGCGAAIAVSAATGTNLDAVRRAIAGRLAHRAVSLEANALALQPRHEVAMRSVAAHLEEATAIAARSVGQRGLADPELAASAMRAALDDLASLAGDITPDDILGRIFASFCVGK